MAVQSVNFSGCKCGCAKRKTRIVGGEKTEVNEYPWQVALYWKKTSHPSCGGSLISDLWILTAAHCTDDTVSSDWSARLGEHDLQTTEESNHVDVPIIQLVQHPQYDRYYNGHDAPNFDFSLLKMETAIDFFAHPHIGPVCLPTNEDDSYQNSVATVTGWGAIKYEENINDFKFPSTLLEVNVTVLSNDDCSQGHAYGMTEISEQMLCANVDGGGKDACQGDSGNNILFLYGLIKKRSQISPSNYQLC